jgi:hypothetical protein
MATAVDRRQALQSAASFTQPPDPRTTASSSGGTSSASSAVQKPTGPDTSPGQPGGTKNPSTGAASSATYGIPSASSAVPGVTIPGANDPAFLAYLRQFGVDEAMVNLMAGHNISSLERELGRALPAFAEQRADAIEGVGSNFEGRGFFRSGSRITGQADAGRKVDREREDFQAKIYDAIRSELLAAASEIASLRRELMERGFDAAMADAIARAQAGL